jgi:hypothetical protein
MSKIIPRNTVIIPVSRSSKSHWNEKVWPTAKILAYRAPVS